MTLSDIDSLGSALVSYFFIGVELRIKDVLLNFEYFLRLDRKDFTQQRYFGIKASE